MEKVNVTLPKMRGYTVSLKENNVQEKGLERVVWDLRGLTELL